MLELLQNHPIPMIFFGWFVPAVFVFWYSIGEYMELREIEHEALTQEANYRPVMSLGDNILFFVTVLLPFANLFCASIVIGVEASDGFMTWILDVCHGREYRKQEREHAAKWTTPL
jgi:hypothetical protein